MFESQTNSASWDSAILLIQTAKRLDEDARLHLEEAAIESGKRLSPLGEPLCLNMGAHRWLRSDREESYSDWLAWILQGMEGIESPEILKLVGIEESETKAFGKVKKDEIRREHRALDGRTDIEVPFDSGFLLIEVKVREPDRDLVSQLKRYTQMVDGRPETKKRLVLIGLTTPEYSIGEFTFTPWRTICERLRRYALDLKNKDTLRAATLLIFCGAVEQNLLGLSITPGPLDAMNTVNYLRRWHEKT